MNPQVILIDDDVIVRETWTLLCRENHVRLLAVATAAEVVEGTPTSTPIFVDHDLGSDVRGADVAKALRARGFTRLYLATGYERRDLPPATLALFDGVVGKDPPAWIWDER